MVHRVPVVREETEKKGESMCRKKRVCVCVRVCCVCGGVEQGEGSKWEGEGGRTNISM